MSNTLLIHIGTPKTGSSSIQHFCCENKEFLLEHGWVYPRYEGYFNSQFKEINGGVFCYPDAFHIMESFRSQWSELWEKTLQLLKEQNVILSNETFWYKENRNFIRQAVKKYDNVKVLVYIRRQDLYLESLYINAVRRNAETRDFETFSDACMNGNGTIPWSSHKNDLDFYEGLCEIEEIVGAQNLVVRSFDKARWKNGSLTEDFAAVLGIQELKEEQKYVRQNQALSIDKLELYLQLNRSISDGERIAYGYIGLSGMAKMDNFFYPDFASGKKTFFMTPEDREKVWKRYEKENEKIANRFYGGKPLFEYDMPKGELWQPTLSDMEKAELGLGFKMHLHTYSEVHKHGLLNTMHILCGNRKLALYGFGRCGREILERYPLPVDIVIDNALCKEKQLSNGMKVVSAQEIEDWTQYFVVVAVRDSREIELQMKEHGRIKNRDYVLGADYFEFVNWDLLK